MASLYEKRDEWYDEKKEKKGGASMSQTIYLADDEKNIRDLIAAFLSQEGFEVKTFDIAGPVREICSLQECFDLIR